MNSDEASERVKVEDHLESPIWQSSETAARSVSGKVPREITSINRFAGKCPRTTHSGKQPFSTAAKYTEGSVFHTLNFSDYSSSNSDSDSELIPTAISLKFKENAEADNELKSTHSKAKETSTNNHSQVQTHVDVEQEDATRPTFSIVQTKESEEKQKLESIYNDTIITPVPLEIYQRLRSLEEKIVHLEETYPAWCAVHFNQPDRQFPPPPPITYVTRNSWGDIAVPRNSFGVHQEPSKTI